MSKKRIKEAIDTGPGEQFFNPQKRSWYETPRKMEKLFPPSKEGEQRHMEKITGDSFKRAIKNIENYAGITVDETVHPMGFMMQILGVMNEVLQTQAPHKQNLEKAAVNTVLQLPEFSMFKDLIANGDLKIDAKLLIPDLKLPKKEEDEEEKDMEIDIEEILADELADLDDRQLRRQFGRMMTQGNAINKLFLFELAGDALDNIDPELRNKYGLISAITHALYYAMPAIQAMGPAGEEPEEEDLDETPEEAEARRTKEAEIREIVQRAAVGSVQIIPNDDGTYTIKARSLYFPYLIHELVKGFYEYLTMDIATDEQLSGETIAQELIEVMSGPQLYANFQKMVPRDKQNLIPMVYKLLLRAPKESIQAVVGGSSKGAAVINNLIAQAQQQLDEYNAPQEEENPYEDAGDEEETDENA